MPTDFTVRLADGRLLDGTQFGAAGGVPVVYFHGSPSSRFEPLLVGDDVLSRAGLRVIAPDRPGMGGSDFQPQRKLMDWPRDVVALADALGLERFAVLGNSGGGPYVAACAAAIPERITRAVIVSGGWRMDWPEAGEGLPLVNRLVMTLARRAPLLLRGLLYPMANVAQGERDAELAQMRRRVPEPDWRAFAEPGRLEAFGRVMRETMRNGTRGAAHDLGLYMRDFGFDPAHVRVPISWLHGGRDTNAPLALARRAVASLPGASLREFPDDAHLSTLCNHFDAVVAELMRA